MTIKFAICGLEHSGTTLISDLFRQIEGVDAGFECGVLLAKSPSDFREFEPFSTNMLKGWQITEEEFSACCTAENHHDFYLKLQNSSRELTDGTKDIFDKTPRYLSRLEECLSRIDVPFIASFKDPRAIVHSDFKRAGTDDFDGWYKSYLPKKRHYLRTCYRQYMLSESNPRVFFVALEELALNARATMEAMFAHAGYKFSMDYMLMRGLRYKNTKANAVSIPIVFSYIQDFDERQSDIIERDFAEFTNWFYH